MSKGMGHLYHIDGIMCSSDYIKILDKEYLETLKNLKIKKNNVLFQQDDDLKHQSKVAEAWFEAKK
ncbi:hypothetical protein AX16_000910, partial [Volvariella volvacea WC 439]